jgi:endogenous inhibitor of DNA gyrase (YacG/DUF329 family)
MMRVRCPLCGQEREVAGLDDLPSFPFCSDRCRLIDLGRWLDGDYAIPGRPAAETPEAVPPAPPEADAEW